MGLEQQRRSYTDTETTEVTRDSDLGRSFSRRDLLALITASALLTGVGREVALSLRKNTKSGADVPGEEQTKKVDK